MARRRHRFHQGVSGAALAVRVIPRASHEEVAEILSDGTVKIRLRAPPVEGRANQALIRFLARILAVPESAIEIIAGHTGRNKLISIQGLDRAAVDALILQNLSADG